MVENRLMGAEVVHRRADEGDDEYFLLVLQPPFVVYLMQAPGAAFQPGTRQCQWPLRSNEFLLEAEVETVLHVTNGLPYDARTVINHCAVAQSPLKWITGEAALASWHTSRGDPG
jgi:hypothetical protein